MLCRHVDTQSIVDRCISWYLPDIRNLLMFGVVMILHQTMTQLQNTDLSNMRLALILCHNPLVVNHTMLNYLNIIVLEVDDL